MAEVRVWVRNGDELLAFDYQNATTAGVATDPVTEIASLAIVEADTKMTLAVWYTIVGFELNPTHLDGGDDETGGGDGTVDGPTSQYPTPSVGGVTLELPVDGTLSTPSGFAVWLKKRQRELSSAAPVAHGVQWST